MTHRCSLGYTLIEVVVAILVFSVGVLALAASSAVIARSMNVDAIRERASRIAEARIESLSANCSSARSGNETIGRIRSEWAVNGNPGRASMKESVSYPTSSSMKTDTYEMELSCP